MIDFFFLGSLFFASITAYILLIQKNVYQVYANRLLSILLLFNCWSIIGYLLISTKTILHVPILYKTFVPINFLIPPVLHLYTKAVLKNEKSFDKKYWGHFILFIVVFISYMPFYLIPYNEKKSIVEKVVNNISLNYVNNDSIIPEWIFYIARNIQFAIYLILQVFLIKKYEHTLLINSKIQHTKEVLNWLKILTTLFILIFISFLILVLLIASNPLKFESNSLLIYPGIVLALSFFTISIYLLLRPQVLFGLPYLKNKELGKTNKSNVPVASLLEEQDLNVLYADKLQVINNLMIHDQIFLRPKLTIYDLAKEAKISARELSFIINKCLNFRFNDFLNFHRIRFVKDQIDLGYLNNFTLESLYLKAGFSNKPTFNAAFKKEIGCTPSNYINKS